VSRQLEEGIDYLSFRFKSVNVDFLSIKEKEPYAREIRRLGDKIEETLNREVFLSAAAEKLKLPITALIGTAAQKRDAAIVSERSRNLGMIESEFLSAFLIRPILIESVWKDISPEDFTGPGHKAIYSLMLESYKATGDIKPDELIEKLGTEAEKSALALIATLEWGDLDLGTFVKDNKQRMLKHRLEMRRAQLTKELKRAEASGDRETALKLAKEIKYLLDKRR